MRPLPRAVTRYLPSTYQVIDTVYGRLRRGATKRCEAADYTKDVEGRVTMALCSVTAMHFTQATMPTF